MKGKNAFFSGLTPFLVALIILPFLVRFQYFTGLRQQIPLCFCASIQYGGDAGPGLPTLESNMGFTAQALGTQASHCWWHGRVPLWNYYEGTGVPLAGEMQSAAFFLPFILLLQSLDGQMYFQISLQIIAGISTFFFLRRLPLVPAAAFCGAVFFELNGTCAWMANAAYNPIAFLPLALLGVECLLDSARRKACVGWTLLCAAAVWSVYAGFPEVAYLDALFVVLYTLVRLTQLPTAVVVRSTLQLTVATVLTLLLIAPLVAQFADCLSFSYNEGRVSGDASIDPRLGAGQLLVPCILGPLFEIQPDYWSRAAGYLGYAVTILSVAAVVWLWRNRLVQFYAVWVALCLLKIYGEPHVGWIFLHVPLMKLVVLHRWLMPSVEFACVVLAAMAVQELFSASRARLLVPALLGAAVVCWSAYEINDLGCFRQLRQYYIFPTLNLLFVAIFTAVCAGAARLGRSAPWVIGGLGILEAVCLFNVPVISSPRHCRFDWEGVAFLQNHMGLQRFYTLGPILPNYGSAFDLAELNYDDMPISRYLADYFKDRLDPYRDGFNTKPDWNRKAMPRNIDVFRQNYRAYAQAGVKYVLTKPWEKLDDLLPEVYHGKAMLVYELPDVRPYFSAEGARLEPLDRDRVKVQCDHPTTLVRLESYTPNWKAYIDGRPVPVRMQEKLFQAVDLPVGGYTLTFAYQAPHSWITTPLFWTGALLFLLGGLFEARSVFSRPPQKVESV